jgi:hypothetical protein
LIPSNRDQQNKEEENKRLKFHDAYCIVFIISSTFKNQDGES